ncbi:hypothetical protein TVAG_049440 [Trichomonas vaginalis G3]|uniref:Uncharacterized protein n=1 Tax=Trichomonas vaginalis (strain ATCC PRA-98 / G3) TaxID=412133 RepID=A2G1D3_TRIV3|nr:hypothetical protein TVAGG3_0134740 [Trichomonas vaginalis G3]EAX89033.1 hypothetical protein TVAG_049440 [Trichomonas vaginalis G3]KAI5546317.1 hypothetical protein TVAGG3_0134740 [Trichomonas vaginalis G3]|eukprot:XP_001301963.1 hypothetical protein [Trichomonas vaginalis G3]
MNSESESSSMIQDQTNTTSIYSDRSQEDVPDLANFEDKRGGILFDYLNNKIQRMKTFSDWAYRSLRNRNDCLQSYDENSTELIPNEDECLKYFTKLKRMRRHKENCLVVVQNAKYYIERGRISQFFDKWRNSTTNKLEEKNSSLSEIYSCSPTEIIGKIHNEIEKQASLETQLEVITAKASDLENLYKQTKQKSQQNKEKLEIAQIEFNRIDDLFKSTCQKYEDEIATLKMNIPIVTEKSKAALEQKRSQLKQRKAAQRIKTDTDNESMETIRAKIKDIQEKLKKKKVIAIDIRTACLAYKHQCDEISNMMLKDSEAHEELSNDVSRIETQVSQISVNNLDGLQKQKENIDKQLISTQSMITQNKAIIQELDRQIEKLQFENHISSLQLQKASHAFADDDIDSSDNDYDV